MDQQIFKRAIQNLKSKSSFQNFMRECNDIGNIEREGIINLDLDIPMALFPSAEALSAKDAAMLYNKIIKTIYFMNLPLFHNIAFNFST